MSINKYYVLDLEEELNIVAKVGFKYFNGYRKADTLIGDNRTNDLILLCLSPEGKQICNEIDERIGSELFVNHMCKLMSDIPTLTSTSAFVLAYDDFQKTLYAHHDQRPTN